MMALLKSTYFIFIGLQYQAVYALFQSEFVLSIGVHFKVQ